MRKECLEPVEGKALTLLNSDYSNLQREEIRILPEVFSMPTPDPANLNSHNLLPKTISHPAKSC